MLTTDDLVRLRELVGTSATGKLIVVHTEELLELARVYAAVLGAEVGQVGYLLTDDDESECHVYRRERFPKELLDQTVCLVPLGAGKGDGNG